MAVKYLAASGSVGASGSQTLGKRITISGTGAVTVVGTVDLKTGGSGGTSVWSMSIAGGQALYASLPSNLAFDYVTIANAKVFIDYYKQHGV